LAKANGADTWDIVEQRGVRWSGAERFELATGQHGGRFHIAANGTRPDSSGGTCKGGHDTILASARLAEERGNAIFCEADSGRRPEEKGRSGDRWRRGKGVRASRQQFYKADQGNKTVEREGLISAGPRRVGVCGRIAGLERERDGRAVGDALGAWRS